MKCHEICSVNSQQNIYGRWTHNYSKTVLTLDLVRWVYGYSLYYSFSFRVWKHSRQTSRNKNPGSATLLHNLEQNATSYCTSFLHCTRVAVKIKCTDTQVHKHVEITLEVLSVLWWVPERPAPPTAETRSFLELHSTTPGSQCASGTVFPIPSQKHSML